MIARGGAVHTRTDAIRHLKSLLVGLPDATRQKLRGLGADRLVVECAKLRPPRNDRCSASVIASVRAIARRCLAATDEAHQHERDIASWVRATCPQLLDEYGVGPISAAQLLISWSHHGRIATDARFARLAGFAPIPASSGNTTRHRLDRGGDRRARERRPRNQGLHTRRQSEGKTNREALRALKRHVTRCLYRTLETTRRALDNP